MARITVNRLSSGNGGCQMRGTLSAEKQDTKLHGDTGLGKAGTVKEGPFIG